MTDRFMASTIRAGMEKQAADRLTSDSGPCYTPHMENAQNMNATELLNLMFKIGNAVEATKKDRVAVARRYKG